MADDHAYAPLDFSSIIGEKFAVHCATIEDAEHFCYEIRRQFGKSFFPHSKSGSVSTNWNNYEEDTCYSPYLHDDSQHMTYCNIDHYIKYGFTIIPFDMLKCVPELDEFTVGEIDLLALFM